MRALPGGTPLPPHRVIDEFGVSLVAGRSCRVGVGVGVSAEPMFSHVVGHLRDVLGDLAGQAEAGTPEIRTVDAGGRLWVDTSGEVFTTGDTKLAMSALIAGLFHHAFGRAALVASAHAAAVGLAGRAILMPGVSGSGKSTLSACLVASGWDYMGDDVVALGVPGDGSVTVLPFCTALGVKAPSWPVVRQWYPEVDDLPALTFDGRDVKFLRRPQRSRPASLDARLASMVFATYEPGADVRAALLTPAVAFTRLVEAGLATGGEIDPEPFSQLLDAIERVPSHALTYSDPVQAERWLRTIAT